MEPLVGRVEFRGRGPANVGRFPLESVVQTLCDMQATVDELRSVVGDLSKRQDGANDLLEEIVALMEEVRDCLRETCELTRGGIEEAQQFRGEMKKVKRSVEALERAQRGEPRQE